MTYFGKPPFHAYGKANTNPTVGGVNYGQNMLSHNINAECGDHLPQYQQVYDSALKAGLEHTKGLRVPAIPLTKAAQAISDEELQQIMARKPIMPKENKPKGKDKKAAPPAKPAIRIAKPEMTLTGFEHTKDNLKAKKKLDKQASTRAEDLKSESKRSRSHRSASVRSRDLRNPDSESDASSNHAFAIDKADAPPMNQEIDDARNEEMNGKKATHAENRPAECEKPLARDPANLNPRNFAFMPSCFTNQIPAAGKLVHRSENVKSVFVAPVQERQKKVARSDAG